MVFPSDDSLFPRASQPHRVALVGECMIELHGTDALAQTFGGDTLNTAVYLSRVGERSGISAHYMSAVGADLFSEAMRRLWRAEGIDDSHVLTLPDALPGLYVIHTDPHGERSFFYWRGQSAARRMFDGEQATSMLAALHGYDCVYVSGITLAILSDAGRERLLQALAQVHANGVRVVFDNNYRPRLWPGVAAARRAWLATLAVTDLAIVTWDDEVELFGYGTPGHLFDAYERMGVREVVIKRGADACLIATAAGRFEVPTQQVTTVVDTTAAGDAFSAGYLAGRLQGQGPHAAAVQAHALAAAVIQHRGALIPRASMPHPPYGEK